MCLKPITAVCVLERIPKAARHQCHLELTTILKRSVKETSVGAWNCLLQYPTHCLRVPVRSGGRGRSYLIQRLSIAEQQGNAVPILGALDYTTLVN